VRLLLERHQEELQRQLAAADAQLGLMQERLADAHNEASGQAKRLQLERDRWAQGGRRGRMILWSAVFASQSASWCLLLEVIWSSSALLAARQPVKAGRQVEGQSPLDHKGARLCSKGQTRQSCCATDAFCQLEQHV